MKTKDIKPLREELLKEQNYRCGLCGENLSIEEAVLDHDHKTGAIRKTIHRGCNAFLGSIENNMTRNRITASRLKSILATVETYREELREEIHPTHNKPKRRRKRVW